MKTQVWVYIVVAVLSLGAGVAIAGVPQAVDRAPTIQPRSNTTTNTTSAVPPLEASENEGDEDAALGDDETVTTDAPVETTATTTTSTTTTTTVPLAERDALNVAVANGAAVGGAASSGSVSLETAGYTGITMYDGTEIRGLTIVFAAEGLQAEAERLAEEIGIDLDLIFPIESTPDVGSSIENVELMVYLGRDVVDLSFFN